MNEDTLAYGKRHCGNERPLLNADNERLPVSNNDLRDLEELYDALRSGNAQLVSPEGASKSLPGSLYLFLVELIKLLNERRSVMIVQDHASLTTMEAANVLGVSRQFLVNLLAKGEIPYHMVGTHRRIYAQDVFDYKTQRDANRRSVLRDLSKTEAEEGIYDKVPRSVDAS